MQQRRRDDSRQEDRTEIERKVQLAVIDLPHEKCGPANEPQRHQIADAERQLDSHPRNRLQVRSEEHTSELQSLMRSSYADLCLEKKTHLHTLPTATL